MIERHKSCSAYQTDRKKKEGGDMPSEEQEVKHQEHSSAGMSNKYISWVCNAYLRVTARHQEACKVMPNVNAEGWIFLSDSTSHP